MLSEALGLFGIFSIRKAFAWRYRLVGILPGGFGGLFLLIVLELDDITIQYVLPVYLALIFILVPWATYAIEKSISFVLGDNFFVFEARIFILLKLLKYALAGAFLPLLVPLGMYYVRSENLKALQSRGDEDHARKTQPKIMGE